MGEIKERGWSKFDHTSWSSVLGLCVWQWKASGAGVGGMGVAEEQGIFIGSDGNRPVRIVVDEDSHRHVEVAGTLFVEAVR
jgi:hypothetical protein